MQQKIFYSIILFFTCIHLQAQLKWQQVDSLYQPLPSSLHVYFTDDKVDTGTFRAYYVIADIKDNNLDFAADTTYKRRLTPSQFYEKNEKALVIVNCTFFSFETNKNLNVVIKDGRLVAYNNHSLPGRGKDTLTYRHPLGSAIGITKKKKADVAWLFTDSIYKYPYQLMGTVPEAYKDSSQKIKRSFIKYKREGDAPSTFKKWKMKTAVGGGPVLLQNGEIKITNNEELKFAGKALFDKHPRTAMGYTGDDKLIILVIEGRNKNAGGATLLQTAQILKDLGCIEALNLDGGGSSCMLVNGKPTIKVSDATGQRPVPAVFLIKSK
jgi:exopolysaccharide biosynthesis protein